MPEFNLQDLRLKEHLSLQDISIITGESKSSLSPKIAKIEESLSVEERVSLHKNILSKKKQFQGKEITDLKNENRRLLIEIDSLRDSKLIPLAEMESFEKGLLAEQLALYRLRRSGLIVFRPESLSKALDLLVQGKSGKYYRCEIKASTVGQCSLSRTKFKLDGGYTTEFYNPSDKIDFFLLVDLIKEFVFVVPFGVFKQTVSITPNGSAYLYRDKFELFE